MYSVRLFLLAISLNGLVNGGVLLDRFQRRSVDENQIQENTVTDETEELEADDLPACQIRQFNMSVAVADENNKECRGQISVNACYGFCESYEVYTVASTPQDKCQWFVALQYGTEEFPNREYSSERCMFDQTRARQFVLDDCDIGADEQLRTYLVQEAVTCVCKRWE